MNTPETVPVVMSINADYLEPAMVTVASLASNADNEARQMRLIVVVEVDGRGAAESLVAYARDLGMGAEVRIADLPEINYVLTMGGSRAAYLRLTYETVLGEFRSCLHLDADMLVMRPLGDLMAIKMGNDLLAAVRDPLTPRYRDGFMMPGWERLGFLGNDEYFNSGVMLMNLEAMRDYRTSARALQFVVEHPESVRLWDQDALNFAVSNRWLRLDRIWNTFLVSALSRTRYFRYRASDLVSRAELVCDERVAHILHYASTPKPWQSDYPRGWARDIYHRYSVLASEIEARRRSKGRQQ